jgi:hypothetical protein
MNVTNPQSSESSEPKGGQSTAYDRAIAEAQELLARWVARKLGTAPIKDGSTTDTKNG